MCATETRTPKTRLRRYVAKPVTPQSPNVPPGIKFSDRLTNSYCWHVRTRIPAGRGLPCASAAGLVQPVLPRGEPHPVPLSLLAIDSELPQGAHALPQASYGLAWPDPTSRSAWALREAQAEKPLGCKIQMQK